MRITVFRGLYWVPVLGNYHILVVSIFFSIIPKLLLLLLLSTIVPITIIVIISVSIIVDRTTRRYTCAHLHVGTSCCGDAIQQER